MTILTCLTDSLCFSVEKPLKSAAMYSSLHPLVAALAHPKLPNVWIALETSVNVR